MDKEKAPCYKCTERRVGCHGSCEKRARAVALLNEEKERIWKAKAQDAVYLAYVKDTVSMRIGRKIKERERKRGRS